MQRFWEKPTQELAVDLMNAGCLWNSLVMVGRIRAFLTIIRAALPELIAAFEASPTQQIDDICALSRWGLSDRRALGSTGDLAVLPARGLG